MPSAATFMCRTATVPKPASTYPSLANVHHPDPPRLRRPTANVLVAHILPTR